MAEKEILIEKGKTFSLVVRWEVRPFVRMPIEAISIATGAPRLTITGHPVIDGWRGLVSMVEGMKQINAADLGDDSKNFQTATVIDADTIELNEVFPVDDNGRAWPAATPNTGFFIINTPVDLTGYTARMTIKDKVGGSALASTEDIINATINTTLRTITLTIDAADTSAITWKKGVTDLEMVSASGVVTRLKICSGKKDESDPVRVSSEVTT